MLSARFSAAGVVAAHTRWSASRPASVTSVTASHCSREPGKWKRRPVSRQIAAYTASVTPMFIALPRAQPISVCGRCTDHVKPSRSAAAKRMSSCT